MGNLGGVTATKQSLHGQPASASFILPPLSILVFRPERSADKAADKATSSPEPAPEKTPSPAPKA